MSVTAPHGWWTRRDAAVHARVSEATIGREVKNARLRCVRVGGRRALRFKREWVDEWLDGNVPAAPPSGPHERA